MFVHFVFNLDIFPIVISLHLSTHNVLKLLAFSDWISRRQTASGVSSATCFARKKSTFFGKYCS